jgi:hypothetical protein
MKKHTALYISTLLFLVIFTPSCKKYLDKKSDNSLIVPKTLQDIQALLDDASLMNQRITPSFLEQTTDDYFLNISLPSIDNYASRGATNQKAYRWQLYSQDYPYPNDWSKNYIPVYNANLSLEAIDKIPETNANKSQWENVKGSALFFRAYSFLNLAWTFAKAYDNTSADNDLGIVLKLSSDFNIKSTRASVRQTYERIITDALEAAELLPNSSLHVFRPSKAAAYGLLARAYLSMRDYANAFKYSNLCLNIKNNILDYNNPGSAFSTPFTNPEIIFYTEENTVFVANSTGAAKIDTILFSTYATADLRRSRFFTASQGYQRFRGSYSVSSSTFFTGIATDEIYLTRAECNARLHNKDSAMADLNFVIKNRWKNTVSYPVITAADDTDALNKILLERRKELIMRGLRWNDIKRLNKEGANITLTRKIYNDTYQLLPNANYYALPLPPDIIALTGMIQNPQ